MCNKNTLFPSSSKSCILGDHSLMIFLIEFHYEFHGVPNLTKKIATTICMGCFFFVFVIIFERKASQVIEEKE